MPPNPKLKKFTDYASTLLPHEVDYLTSVAQFIDIDNQSIFQSIRDCLEQNKEYTLPKKEIDKRKYSRLMYWMEKNLSKIDVDLDYSAILRLEEKIMTDSILPLEEKWIVKRLKNYQDVCYNFMRIYQLAQHLSSFLMIRMRTEEQDIVQFFLEKFKDRYLLSRDIAQLLNDATGAIISQYNGEREHTREWESKLIEVFQNEQLDGQNRYAAIVRLTFLHYNYKDYTNLEILYRELDTCFSKGLFYSKRILTNYYSNRVLIHAHFDEWEKATYYGKLSIKFKGTDYIQYLNNLSAILIRTGKHKEALQYMQQSWPEFKNTVSSHNKVGFVSFYIRSLNRLEQSQEALSYALSFLSANKNEILHHRWHLFFTSIMQSMLFQNKYAELLKLVEKYKLLERDQQSKSKPNYLPTLKWYYTIAAYRMKHFTFDSVIKSLQDDILTPNLQDHKLHILEDTYSDLRKVAPDLPLSIPSLLSVEI